MKKTKIFILMTLFTILTSCKAQTIVDIYSSFDSYQPNVYYKDINNKFNAYVGEWQYTNGTTSLKLVFQKRLMYYSNACNCYKDILVGEYQYIENNVEIVNTLPLLNNSNVDYFEVNSIAGYNTKEYYLPPICSECDELTKRINLNFVDNERKYIFNRSYVGFKENFPNDQIIFYLKDEGAVLPFDDSPKKTRLPEGTYVLTKIN